MPKKIEVLDDVVGINDAGQICHPFKGLQGDKKGFFSYTFENDNSTFKPIDEAELRRLIENGEFNYRGRVRMVPLGSNNTSGAGALRVKSYKGRILPI